MIDLRWQARETSPGAETLMGVLGELMQEALFAGTCDAVLGLSRFSGGDLQGRVSRHIVTVRLAEALERAIGLEFAPSMRIPFLWLARRGGGEPGGYLPASFGFPPSDWALDLLARWEAHDSVRRSWAADARDGNSRVLESARLLRAALFHAVQTGDPSAAVRYVVDVVECGLCRDVTGAARAITLLLRVRSGGGTAEEMVRTFFDGRLPGTFHEWMTTPYAQADPEPRPLSSEGSALVGMLVERAFHLLEEARRTDGFDSWFMALTKAESVIQATLYVLQWSMPRMPLGLRAVHGQLSELDAHYSGMVASLRVARPPVMGAVVRHSRGLAEVFRAKGDVSGDRFAREALLIPRFLLDEPLTDGWREPGHRTASMLSRPDGLRERLSPEQAVVLAPDDPSSWQALGSLLRERDVPWAGQVCEHLAGVATERAHPPA
ncbi:hypothetical protein AB0K18_10065 [Nonomuraea sp. NPDC049421]|uniref:hypothetical protein n=1 Tax=Nonomuraea sp. NPDC049421 TaxID=3155275 RepID=UPI0034387146